MIIMSRRTKPLVRGSRQSKAGEGADSPSVRFDIESVPGKKLCLTFHSYANPESFDARKPAMTRFLLPNRNALQLSLRIAEAVLEAQRIEGGKPF